MRKLRNGSIRFTHWTCCDFGTPGRKDDIYNHTSGQTALNAWVKLTNIYYKQYGYRVWIEDAKGRVLRDTTPEGEPMKFSELAVGDRFRLMSEHTMPHSGMARGPWKKTSARMYDHESDRHLTRVKVGSINTDVQKLAQKEPYALLPDYCLYLAEESYRRYTQMISPHLFLVAKLDELNRYVDLMLVREHPEGYTRVISAPVPRNLATDSLTAWFREALKRAPVLHAIEQHFMPQA